MSDSDSICSDQILTSPTKNYNQILKNLIANRDAEKLVQIKISTENSQLKQEITKYLRQLDDLKSENNKLKSEKIRMKSELFGCKNDLQAKKEAYKILKIENNSGGWVGWKMGDFVLAGKLEILKFLAAKIPTPASNFETVLRPALQIRRGPNSPGP